MQFYKNEGGSKALWNFSDFSDLVARSFPNLLNINALNLSHFLELDILQVERDQCLSHKDKGED